jgi:non-ribosomal peptide synthetase component F
MRYLVPAHMRSKAIDADAISFDPSISDDDLPHLTRAWPSFRAEPEATPVESALRRAHRASIAVPGKDVHDRMPPLTPARYR